MPRDQGPSVITMVLTLVGAIIGVSALLLGTGVVVSWLNPAPASAPAAATTATAAAPSVASTPAAFAPTETAAATESTKLPPTPSVTVTAKKKPAKPSKPAAPPTIPEKMKRTLTGSDQMIVATGARPGSTHGTLYLFEVRDHRWVQTLKVAARFGTNGLHDGTTRVSGDRTTPTGIWRMPDYVFGQHPTAPAGTRMKYRHITADVYWSDVRDATFNTWVQSSSRVSGEHLIGVPLQYEYALSTGFNAPPNEVVPGRGAAIFLHVFDPPDFHNGLSAGCVAVSRDDIVRVFKQLDPAKHPTFAVGTEGAGPTSILAY
jgi:L,D-peptidoglycan transpeptidase YkuD (ErfK/YbiS/YcfS/YnhG family)